MLSEGVKGEGTELFKAATARGLEGIVAKRLDSAYSPGKWTGAWIKVKRREEIECAIIGFIPADGLSFESVILAAASDGPRRLAAGAAYGLDRETRRRLSRMLWSRLRAEPRLPCRVRGALWTEPVGCVDSCLDLREAVLKPVLEDHR